jgi:hypothetical protein
MRRLLPALLLCAGLDRAHAAEPRDDHELEPIEHPPHTAVVLDEEAEDARALDKKTAWLAEKVDRIEPSKRPPPNAAASHPLSLHNMWTDEILPLPPSLSSATLQPAFDRFLRCHFTQQSTQMATGLLPLLRSAAARFNAPLVEIVSGFRAPKYQLMLRKKGHEVARDSAHPRGEAVDFRLPLVPTKTLLAYVRSQKLGGVGYYPVSAFVHADTGKIRFWKGH